MIDKEWADTLSEEYDMEVAPDEESTDIEDTQDEGSDDRGAVDDGREDTGEDEQEAGEDGEGRESEGEAEESGEEYDESPQETSAPKEESQVDPKQALKEALRELEAESKETTQFKESLKASVLERLYPGGIERQLRDSDGDPINGIDDLMNLINPATDDYFTEDEAGAWLLSAQQKLNQDIDQMERQAERVVEVDMNLRQGADRVEALYADVFKAYPGVYENLMQQYNATIIRDPNSGLVIDTPVDIEDFYSTALSGYMKNIELQQKQAAAETKARKEQERNSQHERGDLSRLGHTTNLGKEEQGWADALNEYYND